MKRMNENLDQKRKKIRSSQQTDDNVCPDLSDPQWKKMGKVAYLMIYPVKSSVEEEYCTSCEFFDYGMWDNKTHFSDGMFIVYNRTRDKFEDARRYPLLQRMRAKTKGFAEATLSSGEMNDGTVDISRNRNPSSHFTEETWSGDFGSFYGSDEQVNAWLKETIKARLINQADEDVILAQMIPNERHSTQKIKDNWFRFVQGYETMEEDETGKLITLPRFVLMTLHTYHKLTDDNVHMAPNIVIESHLPMIPFQEENWNWIKMGNEVILRKVKPVPRSHSNEALQHRGIYYGLWSGGKASVNDDVFIHYSDI